MNGRLRRALLSFGRLTVFSFIIVLYIWPGVYNGQPFFYEDTTAYIRGVDAGISRITHRATIWSDANPSVAKPAGTEGVLPKRKSISSIGEKAVLAGRSVYYGGVLYLGDIAGRLWPVVILQSLVVFVALSFTLHMYGGFTWARVAVFSILLAALTPMAFFISFLMPDIFAAITILGSANLVAWGGRMSRWMFITWVALLSAALLFHATHVLIAIGILMIAGSCALITRATVSLRGVIGILTAVVIASLGEAVFSLTVEKLLGAPPIRPPFLMARMISDGPGYRYLATNCRPPSQLTICDYLQRLPISNSDEFLWNPDPSKGIFSAVDPETRRKLGDEQYRFAWAVIRFDPLAEFLAGLRDTGNQMRLIGLSDFEYSNKKDFLSTHVPDFYLGQLRNSGAWKNRVPIQTMWVLTVATTVCSCLYLTYLLLLRREVLRSTWGVAMFTTIIVGGVIVNAMVCGSLSTAHDRYQARVIWLLPLTAMLLGQRLLKLRSGGREGPELAPH